MCEFLIIVFYLVASEKYAIPCSGAWFPGHIKIPNYTFRENNNNNYLNDSKKSKPLYV